PALEALAQPRLERRDISRLAVARDHELAAGLVEGVEGVEELLLGTELVGQELDVVDEQNVGVAEALAEATALAAADGADELARELLDRHVTDGQAVVELLNVVADRVKQVRLPEPRAAVDEERVVRLAGLLGDRECRAVREAVPVADHEVAERVAGVEPARAPPPAARRGVAPPCRRRPAGIHDLDRRYVHRRPGCALEERE